MSNTKTGRLATKAIVSKDSKVNTEVYSVTPLMDATVDIFIANKCSGPAKVDVAAVVGVHHINELAWNLQENEDYADLPFTIDFTIDGLTLIWKESGEISTPPALLSNGVQVESGGFLAEGTVEQVGADAVAEIQELAAAEATAVGIGQIWVLRFDETLLTAAALEAATIADLVSKLQAAVGYADLPFAIAADTTAGIALTWKEPGPVLFASTLTEGAELAIVATSAVVGADALATIQNIAISDSDLGSGYVFTLTHDNAAIEAAPIDSDAWDITDADYIYSQVEICQGGMLRISDFKMSDGETLVVRSDREGVVVRVSGVETFIISEG